MNIIKHYVCYACDNYEDVLVSEEEDAVFEPTVICGGCGDQMLLESQRYDFGDDDGVESSDEWDSEDDDTPSDEYVADIARRLGLGLQSHLQSQGVEDANVSVQARGQDIDLDDSVPRGDLASALAGSGIEQMVQALLGDDDQSVLLDDPESFNWTFNEGKRVEMPEYSLLVPDSFAVDYDAERGFAAYPPDSEVDEGGVVILPGLSLASEHDAQWDGRMTREIHFGLYLSVYHMQMSDDLVGRTYEKSWEVEGEHCSSLIIQKRLPFAGFEFYIHPYHGMDTTWFRVSLPRCPANLRGQMGELASRIAGSITFNTPAQGEFELLPDEFLTKAVEAGRIDDHFNLAVAIEVGFMRDIRDKVCELRLAGALNLMDVTGEDPHALVKDGHIDGGQILHECYPQAWSRSNDRVVAIWSAFNEVFAAQRDLGLPAEDLLALVERGDNISTWVVKEVDLSEVGGSEALRLPMPDDYDRVLQRWEELRRPYTDEPPMVRAERMAREAAEKEASALGRAEAEAKAAEAAEAAVEREARKRKREAAKAAKEKVRAEAIAALEVELRELRTQHSAESASLDEDSARFADEKKVAGSRVRSAKSKADRELKEAESAIDDLRAERAAALSELSNLGVLSLGEKRRVRANIARLSQDIAGAEKSLQSRHFYADRDNERRSRDNQKKAAQKTIKQQESVIAETAIRIEETEKEIERLKAGGSPRKKAASTKAPKKKR